MEQCPVYDSLLQCLRGHVDSPLSNPPEPITERNQDHIEEHFD